MATSICFTPSSTLHTHAMIPSQSSSLQACYRNPSLCPSRQKCRASRNVAVLNNLTSARVRGIARQGKGSAGSAKRSFASSSNHHSKDSSRLRRNPWLPSLEKSKKLASRALRDDTVSEPAVAIEADYIIEEEDFIEEDAALEASGTTASASPLEELLKKSWEHKYLLALAGVPGLFSGLEGPGSVAQSIAVLAAVISVHEAGHFLAARLQGIHVTKFAIGFGPTLAKWQGKEVEYSLRAIPLGGYVAFPDDDPNSGFKTDDPDLLKNRGIAARALVISAGVIANIIFAYTVLFGQVLSVGLVEQEYLPGVIIPEIIARSAASRGGLEAGDVVLSVGGRTLGSNVASVFDLVDTIKDNPGRTLDFEVRRQGFPDLIDLKITPDLAFDGAGKIGVQLSTNASLHRVKANNLGEAVTKASKEFMRLTTTVTEGLKQVFFNFAQTADKLSGPVAIVAVGAEVARSDIAGLFQFAAIVNINLAVVNLLPLPALDGGYLFLIALEALRGKKLPEGVEKGIMSSGILLLLAVGVVLMVRDTLNLGIVQQLL
ncbi:hypothetical protein M758_4G240900 [Ceratodon purpureus]|nr:hypothetical protein M758_4G240900 [Ceratodon purpureus]